MTEEQVKTIASLLAACCTCRTRNGPIWMANFAAQINAAMEMMGSDDRVGFKPYMSEFILVSGGRK